MSNAGRGGMEIQEEEIGAAFREMPEFVKKGLIRVSGGQMYLKAPYRVLWMRSEHKDWSIVTSIEFADYEKGFAVVRAVIMDGEGRILATAHSEESRGKLPYVRKAETGAISRALALCGYGTQFASLEEEADSMTDTSGSASDRFQTNTNRTPTIRTIVNTGPDTCASCRAPKGKPHGSGCEFAIST